MALFKVFRGQRNDLDNVTKVDGHAYFCTDDGSFWIDYLDGTEIKRKQVNESELASLNDKFDDYVLLNDKNVNGNIVLADKKLDSDYELTLTPDFIRLLDSSTSSPSAFILEACGGVVELLLSLQASDHNEYYTKLDYNEIINGVRDEDGNDVVYASLLGGCLEVYSNEYGWAYFAPNEVSTNAGWMGLPQSSNDYHFDFSNILRAAGAISVFETADFANEKWSTSYGWETITWHGVDGSGTPIANTFSLPSETNAGGTLATREWVKQQIEWLIVK